MNVENRPIQKIYRLYFDIIRLVIGEVVRLFK